MNLLNYNADKRITYTNSFIPYINLLTRIKKQSETLIDNTFYNKTNPEATAGNIATSILDH